MTPGEGHLQRQRRVTAAARLNEHVLAREARERQAKAYPAADRYALHRLLPESKPPCPAPVVSTRSKAAAAVMVGIAAGELGGDFVHRTGWTGTRMESRYIQYWIMHHRACHAEDLIAALVDAVEHARASGCGLILPDLAPRAFVFPW